MTIKSLSHLSLDSSMEEIEAELKVFEADYAERQRRYNITEILIEMLENSGMEVVKKSKKIIEMCEQQKSALEEIILVIEAEKICIWLMQAKMLVDLAKKGKINPSQIITFALK